MWEKGRMTENGRGLISRRRLLRQILGAGASLPLATALHGLGQDSESTNHAAAGSQTAKSGPPVATLSPEDEQFLNELEQADFLFFWEQGHPKTGMVKDRCTVRGTDKSVAASIAATGFGLTALCIGVERGFVSSSDALERVFATLRFLWKKLPNHRGFFYHFANPETGERMWDSEVSSVDTALLLCGILTCREYYRVGRPDPQPRGLVVVVGRYDIIDSRLDAGGWIPSLTLGLL
jgi:hypothetical protein